MNHDSQVHLGLDVLNDPFRNKGTAFTQEERMLLRIEGHVPPTIETISEQVRRARSDFDRIEDDIDKYRFLRSIQDSNEVLFCKFVQENLVDSLPIVYTPTVGQAAQEFSRIYQRPRGLFLSWESRDRMRDQLDSVERDIDVIVVTDGERILGLGDQGVGGMGIPIGKLSLYTAFGGFEPARTLPIVLDVGTNNDERIGDPCYLGARHHRIEQAEYDAFVDQFVEEVKRRWPKVLLQWEDFAQNNAAPILERHRGNILSFNDDIQGTAAVSVAVVGSALRQLNVERADQRICILGAGSAGSGIGAMILAAMKDAGAADAQERVILVDADGVVHDGRDNLLPAQVPLAYPQGLVADWAPEEGESALETVVRNYHPTVLIGVSGVPGLFTETAIRTMAEHAENPVILPLSNPTNRSEAVPEDILNWTDGRAIVATGSPFDPVTHNGVTHVISQSNNVYVFPGVGLGVLASEATMITDEMLMAAATAVADPDAQGSEHGVLPPLGTVPDVSIRIAKAVARVASDSGVAPAMTDAEIDERISAIRWEPHYENFT